MADVIDLRNRRRRATAVSDEDTGTHPIRDADEIPEMLEWSALEYEKQEYSSQWFVGVGAVAALFIIIGIFARSYFFVTLIVLAFAVLVLYTRREPRLIGFSITSDGVRAGKTFYEFSQLKSFWIFEKTDIKELSLETDKLLTPFIRLPLGEGNPETIKAVLEQRLLKKEHQDLVSDQIARGLGF
ncbi:MAG: hypothetical protein A3C07_04210 [Candidatus Sungbacteria bacterium RIFCSPHIGHO2_02_FULL_47_11]|uniref:DUF5673 domain-containing protein n=1 Tax=Candidatus Sungbacteria bacterium RIFCSPHIGHO2_02_FULL_47_11 TaxID=1802270 RepID=A0A1G2KI42_9BACT|nr:MAG: hypothetical protein A3C07_04210 [Candidatus Sungbacteria bacterium RIFCSPHIGHO2_02_FULL_47_11]